MNIETNEIIPNLSMRSMTPVAEMTPQSGILRGDECFFTPKVERLLIPSSGKLSPISAIVNETTGEQVGQYMREGSLLPNSLLVQQFESALKEAGYKFTVVYTCYGNGARFEALYTLQGLDVDLGDSKGSLQLKLRNSYDGKWTISMSRRMERLVCLNGMVSIVDEIALAKRHSSRLDPNKLAFNINSAVEGAKDEAKSFTRMIDYKVNDDQALNFLGNAVAFGKNAISKRLASRIAVNHREGDKTDGEGDNLWRLYNAGTRTFRDLATMRPEGAAKANAMWSNLCVLSANPKMSNWAKTAFKTMIGKPKPEYQLIDVESVPA